MKLSKEAKAIMDERFGHDTLLCLATTYEGCPSVRIVNSYYENDAFYTVTYALSKKIKHIAKNPRVAVCEEWFSANGIGENLGWVRDEKNSEIMSRLRMVFAEWYGNGHTDEEDVNTCLLKIRLTDAVLLSHGTRYDIEWDAQ